MLLNYKILSENAYLIEVCVKLKMNALNLFVCR